MIRENIKLDNIRVLTLTFMIIYYFAAETPGGNFKKFTRRKLHIDPTESSDHRGFQLVIY